MHSPHAPCLPNPCLQGLAEVPDILGQRIGESGWPPPHEIVWYKRATGEALERRLWAGKVPAMSLTSVGTWNLLCSLEVLK